MKSESGDEQDKPVHEMQIQLGELLPNKLVLYAVPLAFSFAVIMFGGEILLRHPGLLNIAPIKLISNLLLCGASSFFIASVYYDYRINKAGKRLFRQKNDKTSVKLSLPQLDDANTKSLRRWMGFDRNWLHETEGSNVPSWLGKTIISCYSNLFFLFSFLVFIATPPRQDSLSYFLQILLKAIFLIAVVCLKGRLQLRSIDNLKNICLFVARNSNITYLLKANYGLQVRDE